MPATQIEFDNGCEALDRIVDFGNGEKHLGVAHEAVVMVCQ
jgi:hypothetical protein